MKILFKFACFGLLPTLLASCAAQSVGMTPAHGSRPEIFQVGELEVRLYQDREAMVRDLPPIFTLIEATKMGGTPLQVFGYYDKQNKRIYAINDAKVVIHEFKHYLEPNWLHGVTSIPAAVSAK